MRLFQATGTAKIPAVCEWVEDLLEGTEVVYMIVFVSVSLTLSLRLRTFLTTNVISESTT